MTDQTQRLEIATVKAEIGSNIVYRFSNDAIAADPIPTDSGDIPNLKQVIKGIEEKASVSTSIYSTVAEGLAATAEGGIFLVASEEEDEIYAVWKKVGGLAVDTGKRVLSSQAVEDAMDAAQLSADAAAVSALEAESAASNAAAEFQDIFESDQTARATEFNEFMDSLGYESTYLIYGTDAVVERQTQLVQRDGELYRVTNAADIPLTLTGDWATDAPKLQAVGDIALRQALASNNGAAMIGYKGRTVADRLNDTANVKDYGAIADGTYHPLSERFASLVAAQEKYPHATALTDSIDWAAYQAAINSGAPRVHAPGGHYVLNKGTLCTRDVCYTGDGYSTRIDFSMAIGVGSCMLTSGALTQIGALSASILQGARTLAFAAAPDLIPGDVVIVFNPVDGSWLSDRSPYRAGEMWRVHSIAGNVVTIYGNSTSNYTSGQVNMYRLRGVRCSVDQMHFSPSDTYSVAPFKVLFGDGVKISNYYASDVDLYTGLEVERSFDVSILAPSSPNRSPAVGDEYGITISNCQNFTISSGSAAATRHAIALGGMDDVACVPNRDGLIYGMIIEGIDLASDIGAGDMHGNSDKITYDNCVFRNGAIMQGRDATIRNSLIYGVTSTAGECIYGTEIYGGTFTIENNRFVSYGNGASFGYVHISPGVSLAEKLHVVARNNTFELPNAMASSKVFFLRNRNSPRALNADIDGVHVIGATVAMQCFLFADDQVLDALISDYLIIDRVFGPFGTYLLQPTAKNAEIPTRQMRQSGSVAVTTTASGSAVAAAQTFRYPYSKMPNAPAPGVSSLSGADQSVIGSISPIGIVYNVGSTRIRPGILAATGSFAAGGTARLHWSTSIDDI